MILVLEKLVKEGEGTELFLNMACDTLESLVPQSGQDISQKLKTKDV